MKIQRKPRKKQRKTNTTHRGGLAVRPEHPRLPRSRKRAMIGFLCYQVKQKSASREGDRSMKVAIKQHKNLATPTEIDGQDHLIAVIPKARWPEQPKKKTKKRHTKRHGADNGPLVTVL